MRKDGCKQADLAIGNTSSCIECPFSHCVLEDRKGWANLEDRLPGRILVLWHQYRNIRKVSEKTRVSEKTVKRVLQALRPPTWGPEWRNWRNKMIIDRRAEGKTICDISKIFKISPRQVSRIIKDNRTGQSSHDKQRERKNRQLSTIMTQQIKSLESSQGYELYSTYNEFLKWLMVGDREDIKQGKMPEELKEKINKAYNIQSNNR